jgi:general secretion pathway protein G
MFGKFAKAVLITTGAILMFPAALGTRSHALIIAAAGGLVLWFLGAIWRIIVLCRTRAFRAGAEPWNREALGFVLGIIIATPALVLLLANAFAVHETDDRTITAGPKAAFERALDMYHTDTGSYPTDSEGLSALIVNSGAARWAGPYISPDVRRYIGWFDYFIRSDGSPVLKARPRDRRRSLP